MKKKRNMITLAFFLTLAMLVLVGTYVTPTANAINDFGTDKKKVDEDFGFPTREISVVSGELEKNNAELNIQEEDSLDSEKEELKKEFGIVDKSKKIETVKVEENEDMVGYLESLEKIRENYLEIEEEIRRLEKMKSDLEMKDEELTQTNNEIYLLRRELMGIKENVKSEGPSFFSSTFTLINLGIFAMIILFTRGRKQIDIHKERYYYLGKRRKHFHKRKG